MTLFFFQYINHNEKFKCYLHLQHANIKMNNTLSFLDIKIVRESNKVTSGLFTNFESFIPNSYKYTLIFTLLHSFKLCFNHEPFYQEIENLKNIF